MIIHEMARPQTKRGFTGTVCSSEPVNCGSIDSIAPANRSGTCFCPSVHYDYHDRMCGYVQ
ncbi:hypothetical protein MGG_15572 [Pyricularia oryzae 70-15]|uniref:Uncharacterized protein n=4 Tax=Pyricularia oryzae TaxID=318829 RepID=G4MTT6_PYRO7|nr:uncharacterized protein MGG_15572 [Pyricularia oryzae 70-15]ELQ42729.1 hypothetical protein OOU_Y34scaffold00194g42 [Pyricularia oryzae Y34]KAI7926382.1 hypothetical protein M9X92_002728 [Pyricularia oryzae]EHA53925.1 hypothetical protein MGG_15572 [Pyricularia oryzae 70-15]KAI7929859.1 hypothetical protein M0657_002006 [Pyricularia oryzae]QBZ55574.1 hypothetical protein PoMZ_00473 [Pyricularia oryzae]